MHYVMAICKLIEIYANHNHLDCRQTTSFLELSVMKDLEEGILLNKNEKNKLNTSR